MEVEINQKKFKSISKCPLCYSEIGRDFKITKISSGFLATCMDCFSTLTNQEIELIIGLIKAYGGYFNKNPESQLDSVKTIGNLIKTYLEKKQNPQNRVKLYYEAMTRGIAPSQVIRILQDLES